MRAIKTEIAVVGAGIAGLSAALSLSQAGLKVVHVRQSEPPAGSLDEARPFDRRVYAIAPASRALFEAMSVWESLPAGRIAPVYDMRVYPAPDQYARELHLSAYEAGCEALAWIVESGMLISVLEQALRFAKVRSVVGTVANFDPLARARHSALTLADGQVIEAQLVVAADGAGSPLRGLAGIAQTRKPYHQKGMVAPLALGEPHRDSAWQWFGSHGVLAVLPMPRHRALDYTNAVAGLAADTGGHRASLVWSAHTGVAEQMLGESPAVMSRAVTELTGGQLGRIDLLEPAAGFDLSLCRASSLVGDRLVLVGDAAHVIHPLAGQGLNLGLADVAVLARTLSQAREQFRKASFDAGNALLLRRYQRQRAEPVAAMQQITDLLSRAFDPAQALLPSFAGLPRKPIELVRDAGWRLAAEVPFFRKQFVRYATQSY